MNFVSCRISTGTFAKLIKTKTKVELNNLSGRFHQRELEFTNQAGLQSGCMGAVISGTSL